MIGTSHRRPRGLVHGNAKHRVIEQKHDWLAGALAVALILTTNAWLDKRDAEVALQDKVRLLNIEADFYARALTERDQRPSLKLDGDHWTCSNWNVRHEWELAAARKCEELANFMRIAAK